VAAHCATPLADEGPVPLSVLPLVTGVIVPPDRDKKEKEHEWSHYNVDLYWNRRYGWWAGHYYANVNYQSYELSAAPESAPTGKVDKIIFGREGMNFGKLRTQNGIKLRKLQL